MKLNNLDEVCENNFLTNEELNNISGGKSGINGWVELLDAIGSMGEAIFGD